MHEQELTSTAQVTSAPHGATTHCLGSPSCVFPTTAQAEACKLHQKSGWKRKGYLLPLSRWRSPVSWVLLLPSLGSDQLVVNVFHISTAVFICTHLNFYLDLVLPGLAASPASTRDCGH